MDDMLIRKKLIEYLPAFTAQFREMQEIMNSEDMEFDLINRKIPEVLNNAFIEDCNEYGIQKYESLLKIIPDEKDSLKTRKTRVLLHWNDCIPYTYKALIMKLNILCGVNNYDIDADLENYHIQFSIYSKVNITDVENFLKKILPLNIDYEIYYAIGDTATGRTGIVWQNDEILNLRQVII